MTLQLNKGLEFPVVPLVCVGRRPDEGGYESQEAHQLYAALGDWAKCEREIRFALMDN